MKYKVIKGSPQVIESELNNLEKDNSINIEAVSSIGGTVVCILKLKMEAAMKKELPPKKEESKPSSSKSTK